MSYSEFTTLTDVLVKRAERTPDKNIYTFLVDGEDEVVTHTYFELHQRAVTIAAELRKHHKPGDRALLLYPPGLDYIAAFFGCLYAGMIAIPAYPTALIQPEKSLHKLLKIIDNSHPTAAMSVSNLAPMMEMIFNQALPPDTLKWHSTDELENVPVESWVRPNTTEQDLAFLQYTSGSTSAPKGVMLSHENLIYNLEMIKRRFEHTEDSSAVIWLPPYHDMGLIGGIFQPLYAGFPVALMSPLSFLKKPWRWVKAMSKYQATTSGGPNFAFDLVVRKTTPEQRVELDLSAWNVAFNGAEPVRATTLDTFTEAFEGSGFQRKAFYVCYGLAEAALFVTGGRVADEPIVSHYQTEPLKSGRAVREDRPNDFTQPLVGAGAALDDELLRIVDPETFTVLPEGEIGEIWVKSGSVAQGYWGMPEKTAETFGFYTNDTNEGPFMRTGDLGFLQNEELFVAGRVKDVIIVRGRNHYPQDIELSLEESHPAFRPGCGAAFAIEEGEEEKIVVVFEVQKGYESVDIQDVIRAARTALSAHHGLKLHDLVMVKRNSIPKTSSGKIQRHASRQQYLDGTLEVAELLSKAV